MLCTYAPATWHGSSCGAIPTINAITASDAGVHYGFVGSNADASCCVSIAVPSTPASGASIPFVDPALPAPQAPLCWTIGSNVPTLDALAERVLPHERRDMDLNDHAAISHVIVGPDRVERIVLRDAVAAATVRARGARACQGSVTLTFQVAGVPSPLGIARHFGRLNNLLRAPVVQAPRSRERMFMRDALIALDARQVGASYRDIAVLIHGAERVSDTWQGRSSAMKERVRHLVARGQQLRDGAYRRLLE
jgi:hypothetical protein